MSFFSNSLVVHFVHIKTSTHLHKCVYTFVFVFFLFSTFKIEGQIHSIETYKAVMDYSEDAKFVDALKEIAEEEDKDMNFS